MCDGMRRTVENDFKSPHEVVEDKSLDLLSDRGKVRKHRQHRVRHSHQRDHREQRRIRQRRRAAQETVGAELRDDLAEEPAKLCNHVGEQSGMPLECLEL